MTMGLYSGAAAINTYERRHEAISANLANISTPGYRRRVNMSSSEMLGGRNGRGRGIQAPRFHVGIDFTPGDIYHTGAPLDVALQSVGGNDGNAFFTVGTDLGEQYTRNGRLSMDGQGQLIHSASGYPLLAPNGSPVTLNPEGGSPIIDKRGNIIQDGNTVGQLKVVSIGRLHALRPAGHGLFETGPANPVESAIGPVEVRQGFLESSNAGAVDEMVEMVANFRAYETSQRVMRQIDQSLQKLLRQTAK